MSENNSKSTHNDYCKFCGNKISPELSKKIKANKENVVCELCGCQLLLITNISKGENRGTELITDIKKEHHDEITEDLKEIYRLNIYNADREKFGYYLTIFTSRTIYNIIKQSNLGLNITDRQIEMISNSIMLEIINNRVDKEWLSEFKPIKKKFKKFYKKLQSELSSNQALQEVFWEFFRLLVKIIITLINKKDYSELQEIEYDIAEYLVKGDLFVSHLRFTVPFRYNLKICLSRLIFLKIKDIACKSNLKFCQLKLSNIEKRNISDEIITYLTSHNEIINKFLGELYKIKPSDFNEFYKYLCFELKSDNLFAESFNYYIRWLIGHVHNIVCGKYKWKELSHFDRIIGTKLAELIDMEVDFEKIRELRKNCQNTVEISQNNLVNPEVNELSAEIKKDNIELLKERYKQETGGRALYAGKETKGFKIWKESLSQTQADINEELSEVSHTIKDERVDAQKSTDDFIKLYDYNKRVKIEPLVLRKFLEQLKNKEIGLITRLSKHIGSDIYQHINQEHTFSIIAYTKLKEFIRDHLGKQILSKFPQDEIPHEIFIGSEKEINLEDSKKVSELLSIYEGDGYINEKTYENYITLNNIDEPAYVNYVQKLLDDLFPGIFQLYDLKGTKAIRLRSGSKSVHHYLNSKGLVPGNKVKHQIGVHPLAFRNKEFAVGALKGLFDTDGSISLERNFNKISLSYVSSSKPLVEDFKKLSEFIGVKTGNVNGPYIAKKGEPYYTIRIAGKSEMDKFIKIVGPEKFKEPLRRVYYGTSLIIANFDHNDIIIKDIEDQILKDYPKKWDRRYSNEFSLYLKDLTERMLIKHGCLNIYGIPFDGKISDDMIKVALERAISKTHVAFTKDNTKVQFINKKLKLEICELIIEFLKENKHDLSNDAIYTLLKEHFYKKKNFELMGIFSNNFKDKQLSDYLDKYLTFISAFFKATQDKKNITYRQAKKQYKIYDQEHASIRRFLKGKFPKEFDF